VPLDQYELAHLAFEIERIDLGLPGGRQDQYSAAFGGTNFIEFLSNDRVIVNPLRFSGAIRNEFESSLVICFCPGGRDANTIIAEQKAGLAGHNEATMAAMHRLRADATAMKNALLLGDIGGVARILEDSWKAKQLTASGISNPRIDRLCETAAANGAIAGKISGAGGGGCLMFIVPPEERLGVIGALNAAGGTAGPVKLTDAGVRDLAGKTDFARSNVLHI